MEIFLLVLLAIAAAAVTLAALIGQARSLKRHTKDSRRAHLAAECFSNQSDVVVHAPQWSLSDADVRLLAAQRGF